MASDVGLGELTIGTVAKAAGVSTALVHYHFDTKQALIVAAAERAATDDAAELVRVLSADKGLVTLDGLWEALVARAASGRSRFTAELRLRAATLSLLAPARASAASAALEALGRRLPSLLQELGSRLAEPREEIAAAVMVFLDGVALSLAGGAGPTEVRAAYDAFWLALIAAGQDARRR